MSNKNNPIRGHRSCPIWARDRDSGAGKFVKRVGNHRLRRATRLALVTGGDAEGIRVAGGYRD